MEKRFVVALVAIVVILGGVFWFTKSKENKTSTNNNSSQASASEHKKGQGTKGVTLLEYGDLQCPACGKFYPLVKQVKEKYGDDITFQYRHFPLVQIHPNAMAAARAAEAAGKQNKFWEMHDMMYENQQSWANGSNATKVFEDFATQLGLNVDQFKKDTASSEVVNTVNADIAAGKKAGADSTPTFVLNGKKIEENPGSVDGFSKLIDEAIKQKSTAQ